MGLLDLFKILQIRKISNNLLEKENQLTIFMTTQYVDFGLLICKQVKLYNMF